MTEDCGRRLAPEVLPCRTMLLLAVRGRCLRALHEIVGVFSRLNRHHADPDVSLTVVPVLALFAKHEKRAGARTEEHWAEASDHRDVHVMQAVVRRQSVPGGGSR